MIDVKKEINVRRYFNWSRIVRDKPMHIRLYELIYFEILIIWLEKKNHHYVKLFTK